MNFQSSMTNRLKSYQTNEPRLSMTKTPIAPAPPYRPYISAAFERLSYKKRNVRTGMEILAKKATLFNTEDKQRQ